MDAISKNSKWLNNLMMQGNSNYNLDSSLGVAGSSSQNDYSILQLKQKKNVVHKDSQLLANRISLLQTEENRLLKKIENTRKRAEQILEIKRFNDNRHSSLIQAEQHKELSIQKKQQQELQERLMRKQEMEARSKSRFEYLRGNANELKD